MNNKRLKSKITELDKSKSMSLEEFVDKTIGNISKDLKQDEEQEKTEKNSDSQRNFKICCALLDKPEYLERMFPSILMRLEARKYIESKMKDYGKVMYEEILVTIWEKVEKSLINDVEKAKDDVLSSGKSKNINESELEFESQKAGILKLCEMHDLLYLKDRLKIKIPAEIDTEEEREKTIDFLSNKLHNFQAQQFERYLDSVDEKKRSIVLSHIWYYSEAHDDIIKKYISDKEKRFLENATYFTNDFANSLMLCQEVQDATYGHRMSEPAFEDYEEYVRFKDLQQKVRITKNEESSINYLLKNDSNLPLAERVILYRRKENIEKNKNKNSNMHEEEKVR